MEDKGSAEGIHLNEKEKEIPSQIGKKLAPFNPIGDEVMEIALELLVSSRESHNVLSRPDILYDLGCGDARLLVKACNRYPHISRAVGIEYDQEIYKKACERVTTAQLQHRISLLHDNVLNIDFCDATCIYIYLVPEGMKLLRESLLAALDRGVRIVTYVFSIPDVAPKEVRVYKSSTKLYLYER